MDPCRQLIAAGALGCLVACADGTALEPGTLVITLTSATPAATNAAALDVAGQVVRTPPARVVVVISAAGGPTGVLDTADADGSFALDLPLTANAQNSFSLTATDESGSTSGVPVIVEVRHDNQPPQLAGMTPAVGSDGVTPANIQVVFSEPVVPGSPNVLVTQYGATVAGTVDLSADSMTLTFTPAAAFAENAVHVVNVTSSRDVVGNILSLAGGCFITGGPNIQVFPDTGPLFSAGTTSGLVPPDLQQIRFSRSPSTLFGVLQFDAARTLDPNGANNTSVWLDLDVDQDGGTGFVTYRDYQFASTGLLPPSGASSEFFIEMGTLLDIQNIAIAAQYTAQDTAQGTLQITGITPLSPAACGAVIGFSVPFAALGSDDGAFDATVYVDAISGTGLIGDGAPDAGFYRASLTAVGHAWERGGPVPDPAIRQVPLGRRRPWSHRVR